MTTISSPTCLFCKIVAGQIPCHKVWEDANHLAFLTIFPNTDGFTVVITKEHHGSYAFAQDDKVLTNLVLAAKTVGKKIDTAFPDVGRTGLMFEGFGVDHLHAKLFPMHGTGDMKTWAPIHSHGKKFFHQYEGYMSSHDGERAPDEKLAQIAAKIKNA